MKTDSRRQQPVFASIVLAVLSFVSNAAIADENTVMNPQASNKTEEQKSLDPFIIIGMSADLQFNMRTGENGRQQSVYTKIEPEITLNLSDHLRIFSHLIFEPVRDPLDHETNLFRYEGLYAEELYAAFKDDKIDVRLGKIDPLFGMASDNMPGLYGGDLASNYDVLGTLGLSAKLTLSSQDIDGENDEDDDDPASIDQSVEIAAFTSDTTILSRSILTDRGAYSWSDSKVANTDFPSSFTIAYDYSTIDDDDEIIGPSARLALRRLASRSDRDEWGMLAAGQTVIDIGGERTLKPMAEIAYFIDEQGARHDALAGTTGLEIVQGAWSLSLAAAFHDIVGMKKPGDYLLSGNIGRNFDAIELGKFRIDLGYRHAREDGEAANMIGLRLHKDLVWKD